MYKSKLIIDLDQDCDDTKINVLLRSDPDIICLRGSNPEEVDRLKSKFF